MAKVHIVQCLCPQRHAIIGISYEEGASDITPQNSVQKVREMVEAMLANGELNTTCALCQSTVVFTYEDGPTPFNSMEEALPALAAAQLGNFLARMEFDAANAHKQN